MRGREANTQEDARLWHQFVATYSGYAAHEKRTARILPVVILEPKEAEHGP